MDKQAANSQLKSISTFAELSALVALADEHDLFLRSKRSPVFVADMLDAGRERVRFTMDDGKGVSNSLVVNLWKHYQFA